MSPESRNYPELEVALCPVHKALDKGSGLKPLDNCVACIRVERDELRAKVKAAMYQLESDRTQVADCLTKANRAIDSRHWLSEGRGSYEWNDDRWHDEFRAAAVEINAALEPLTRIAADWSLCPMTSKEVAQARIDLGAQLDELRAKYDKLKSAVDTIPAGLMLAGGPPYKLNFTEACIREIWDSQK